MNGPWQSLLVLSLLPKVLNLLPATLSPTFPHLQVALLVARPHSLFSVTMSGSSRTLLLRSKLHRRLIYLYTVVVCQIMMRYEVTNERLQSTALPRERGESTAR